MIFNRKIAFFLMLGASLSQISCLRAMTPPGPDVAHLLAVASQYGKNSQPIQPVLAGRPVESPMPSTVPALEDESTFRRRIAANLNQGDFTSLESEAREDRASKGRLLGGEWKLNEFYSVVSDPSAGSQATDAEWANQFEILKKWKAAQPDSATALIALAQADVDYAWTIRGSGYANTVSGNRWTVFGRYLDAAASALLDADRLRDKCPYWYQVMQQVAQGQGWSKSQARELFEQATAFEPEDYHYYRAYAIYLLPKWFGEEGETETFAAEAADRLGGPQGDFVYFEVASVAVCTCVSDKPSMPNLSWTRIKRGYAVLTQLYGISDLKANRYALMAYGEDDKAAAKEAFTKVGENLSDGVWRSRQSFEDTKVWANTR